MSWENEYKSKLTTAEKAVELIKSGNRVVIGHACAEPSYLVDAMVANAESYHDVEIVHMVAMGKAGYAQPGMESHFRHNALFVGGTTRKAVAEGRGETFPLMAITARVRSGNRDAYSRAIFAPSLNPKRIQDGI